MLKRALIDSEAFNNLKPSAVVVLISILRRYNGRNGINGDEIECPYSEMKCHLANTTIANGLRALEEAEYIKRKPGGLMRHPNKYLLLEGLRKWLPKI